MGLFRKRKVEVINLELKEVQRVDNFDTTNFYSEKADYVADNFNNIDLKSKKDIVNLDYTRIQKSNYDIINDYLVCKIFSRIALKDKDFNLEMLSIDKHINRVKKEYESLQRVMNQTKYSEEESEILYNESYEKLKEIDAFHKTIKTNIEEAKSKYFNFLKIATVNVGLNKTNQELELLYKNLNEFLQEYKTLKEASEYIYYNSSNVIISLVETLLSIIHKHKNKEYLKTYDVKYFLKSDVVITLDIPEWIELYNKIKFTVKSLSDVDFNKDFKDKFNEFEMRYLILMMGVETSKKIKK